MKNEKTVNFILDELMKLLEARKVMEANGISEQEVRKHFEPILDKCIVPAEKPFVVPKSCNRHNDCRKADEEAEGRGFYAASHCHSEDCEDCFGC